ncbi:MAG: DUF4037 domain-containing protein [Thermomicrobiales bacterium]
MAHHAPGLPYAAGLFGAGSDVLGYDTARSMDHDWGPRLILMLDDADWDEWSARLDALFRQSLPRLVAGFPTGMAEFVTEPGNRHMIQTDDAGPINHPITITTVGRWFGGIAEAKVDTSNWVKLPADWLASVASASTEGQPASLDPVTWATISQQWLLEMTSGSMFRDDIGAITNVRAALTWYPEDVWRYLMAAQWMRIDQLEPSMRWSMGICTAQLEHGSGMAILCEACIPVCYLELARPVIFRERVPWRGLMADPGRELPGHSDVLWWAPHTVWCGEAIRSAFMRERKAWAALCA